MWVEETEEEEMESGGGGEGLTTNIRRETLSAIGFFYNLDTKIFAIAIGFVMVEQKCKPFYAHMFMHMNYIYRSVKRSASNERHSNRLLPRQFQNFNGMEYITWHTIGEKRSQAENIILFHT